MKIPPFIRKLKLIIQGIAPEIAGWNEDGNVFEVCDPKAFTNELGKHFKGNEQTFIRQLNLYGFTKVECTRNLRKLKYPLPPALPGAWSFSHPLVLRDSLDLMDGLVRNIDKKSSVTGQQTSNSVDSLEEIDDDYDDDSNSNGNMNNNSTVRISSREWNQMRRKNRDLEAAVETLQSRLSTLTMFLEEEGFDVEAIRASSQSSLLLPSRKKQKQSDSTDDTEGISKNKKREREWYDLSQPFEKQLLMDLLFQPSPYSPLSFDDDNAAITQGELQSITDQQHNLSSTATATNVKSSEAANQQYESTKPKENAHVVLGESFLDSLNQQQQQQQQALDLEFAHELQYNQQQSSTDDACSSRKCKCKTESMMIDSVTLSKVVKHFREVLRIVMSADISCGSSCPKTEVDDPFNISQPSCCSTSDKEQSKANSCCSTESNDKNESGCCCSSSSNLENCCSELKRKFKSNPIQHLLTLQQVKAEL